ncbi:MAG: hypothetical protein H7839_23255 [Magnetococcus sp. YQC-5]
MTTLDESETDAFKELFNLSFSKAAATLSEMVDAEVTLSLPCLSMLPRPAVAEHIHSLYGTSIGLVGMRFQFEFSPDNSIHGMAVLMIRASDIGHLLDALYGSHIPDEKVAELEEEALQLAGAVLLYTCTSSLSALFASEIVAEKPNFFKGDPAGLNEYLVCSDWPEKSSATASNEQHDLLMLRVDFSLLGKEVYGSLLTWMDGEGLPSLKVEIDHFIAAHMV